MPSLSKGDNGATDLACLGAAMQVPLSAYAVLAQCVPPSADPVEWHDLA